MKELQTLVDDLNEHITIKEFVVINSKNFNSYIESELLDLHKDIKLLNEAIKLVPPDLVFKQDILLNFQKEALDIKIRIAAIPKNKF